jgi:hypothetical protein
VSRAIRRSTQLLGAENLVAFGYVFWLLLDLIQGAYDLRDAADWALRDAFIAVGVSAAAMWIGAAGRPWKLPNWLGEIASREMDTRTVARLVPVCFILGMLNFAYATGFDMPRMFSYLGESRWSAPWGRGQLGGWNAFADQLQYFGYVLPSLTALLIVRRGFNFGVFLSIPASAVRFAFPAGRRLPHHHSGVGAAVIVWIRRSGSTFGPTIAAVIVVGADGDAVHAQHPGHGRQGFAFRGEAVRYLHVDFILRLAR